MFNWAQIPLREKLKRRTDSYTQNNSPFTYYFFGFEVSVVAIQTVKIFKQQKLGIGAQKKP